MRRADIGIRIRADAKFARLVDKAAELNGQTRSGFIRSAALFGSPPNNPVGPDRSLEGKMGMPRTYDEWKAHNPADEWLGPDPFDDMIDAPPCDFEKYSGECLVCGAQIGERCDITGEVNE